ncbi:MAG: TAXI family TRAP transporter solute-binding subunit, partial [Rhodobacterales bacterium]
MIDNLFKGVVTACLLTLAGAAHAQDNMSIGASGSGSGPYINGALMADTANKAQDGFKFSVQTTGGYKDNLGLVLTDKVDIALNTLIGLNFAYNQRDDYASSPMKDDFKRLRSVFVFGAVPHNIFVRDSSGINSLDDIRGKPFNINVPSSFTHGLNLKMLEAAGIELDEFEVGKIPTGQVFDQIQNGIFEGGAHVYQLGLGNAQRLSAVTPIRYLDISQTVIDKMNEGYFGLLVPYEIPADTYKGQDNVVKTFGLAQVVYTDENADEEMIYQFTKAFWENIQMIQESNTSF